MRFIKHVLVLSVLAAISGCGGSGGSKHDDEQFTGNCTLRVSNGTQCVPDRGPVALVVMTVRNVAVGLCTGSFLTPNDVLTAAHCFAESGADGAQVWAGDTHAIASTFALHPSYTTASISPYDVAVIHFDESLDATTIPLLESETVVKDETLNVIGFGLTGPGETATLRNPGQLLHVGEMSVNSEQDGFIVATPNAEEQTICPGDSGGPAIVKNTDGVPAIVGVANSVLGQNISELSNCQNIEAATFVDVQNPVVFDWIVSQVPKVHTL